MSLTDKEKATNYETFRHIENVRNKLNDVVRILLRRGELHDQSKLDTPEVEIFSEYTEKLAGTTYGSEEYKEYTSEMKPALEHHYAKNRHHPEHFENGIKDMTLYDLIEMYVDWCAAAERHNDGNILKSIKINKDRFNISDELAKILENTAKHSPGE